MVGATCSTALAQLSGFGVKTFGGWGAGGLGRGCGDLEVLGSGARELKRPATCSLLQVLVLCGFPSYANRHRQIRQEKKTIWYTIVCHSRL